MKIYVQAWRPAGDDLAETRAALDGWVSRIGEELHAQSVAYSQG